jgi:hypothetical protein
VLLDENANCKISDFGSTKIAEKTINYISLGDGYTPRYSGPEIFDEKMH